MKLIYGLTLAVVSLCGSTSALAKNICPNEPTTEAVHQCTVQQKKIAEDELNKEYIVAKKRIEQMYGTAKTQADEYISKVVETQRSWLKYRDGQCELEASAAEVGSSAHDIASNICIVRFDKERTDILKQLPY